MGEGQQQSRAEAKLVEPEVFERQGHFYPKALNARLHPTVQNFLELGNDRIAARFCNLNRNVNWAQLRRLLAYNPAYLRWAGTDLIKVANGSGEKLLVVIETNSCPSGVKSMPKALRGPNGFQSTIERSFAELLGPVSPDLGGLAVVYDINAMEANAYAAAMAEFFGEKVFLAEFHRDDPDPPIRWVDGLMEVRDAKGVWHPIRGAFRFVTQTPWNRFPLESKTVVLNPIVACLAGGRNKITAAKAYESFNNEISDTTMAIRTPETFVNVAKEEIPSLVALFGGHAALKVPYSNRGEDVYTVVNEAELNHFMGLRHNYEKFVVQRLIGHADWYSTLDDKQFRHVGTIPDSQQHSYVADLRFMVVGGSEGFLPVAIYARRAREPLGSVVDSASWDMLGTNLSVKFGLDERDWTTETDRLLMADVDEFDQLGLGMDDLVDGYIQTVLAVISIDKLCRRLMEGGRFDRDLFASLNPDSVLLDEIFST